jgi:hypothetical protein
MNWKDKRLKELQDMIDNGCHPELGMHSKPQEEPPEKTLVSDLNMDLILKAADTFKKSSKKIMAKKTYTWEEINEYLGEHEKIVKIYRDQMWNYFHR